MSFHDCIDRALLEGVLTDKDAAELHQVHRRNAAAHGNLTDDTEAARETFDFFETEINQKRRRKLLAVQVQRDIAADIGRHVDSRGRPNPFNGLRGLVDSRSFGVSAPGADQLYEYFRSRFHRRMARAFSRFERNWAGFTRNKAELDEVVEARFGATHVSAEAKEISDAFGEMATEALRLFNRAGGNVNERADWSMPPPHNWDRIRETNREEWKADVVERLNRDRVIDGRTGRPISDARLDEALDNMYLAGTTNGWSRRDAGSSGGDRSLANSRAEARFLQFKDGDAWRSYAEKYGEGDAFKAMVDYLDGMAHDIAMMQRFGPNPRAGLEYAKQVVDRDAHLSGSQAAIDQATTAARETDQAYRTFTGESSIPVRKWLAHAAGEQRNFLMADQLGAAVLSAISDLGFGQITARMNGLPGVKLVMRQLALMWPEKLGFDGGKVKIGPFEVDVPDLQVPVPFGRAAERQREHAIAMGLIADEAGSVLALQQRLYGETWSSGLGARMADSVMRLSGLSGWTQSGRWAYGMESQSLMGRFADDAFDDLPNDMRAWLGRYGIDATGWNVVREGVADFGGARFIDPHKIPDEKLSQRLFNAVRSETHFSVPSVSIYGRSVMTGELKRGTWVGEVLRSPLMYKNFGVTLLLTHGRRMATMAKRTHKAMYFGALLATTSALGALSLQLKEVSKGRDPRPMTGEKFWTAAMLQGGGLGIVGDYLFSDMNRFGRSWLSTFAGPALTQVGDVMQFTLGNFDEWRHGKDTKIGKEFVDLLERYTPGGSLWYARLAFQRMVLDQLRDIVDPDSRDSIARVERNWKQNYAQDFWWRPGQALPQRGLDISNTIRAEAQPR